ncbi:hypothetical protein [Corynebacterium sp.]|uniref:hypothetical protein n=1 Tax=Corynebacterium sp. TaxID=1720 RepID=UPI0025BA3950|nr:hypothetical protein [Corynebacterium sp.]
MTADRATLDRLASSLNNGDLEVLVEQLSEGCVLWTDSGGLTRAARNPIHGQERVTRFLAGLIAKYGMPELCVVDAVGGPVVHAASSDILRHRADHHAGGGGGPDHRTADPAEPGKDRQAVRNDSTPSGEGTGVVGVVRKCRTEGHSSRGSGVECDTF